jgi:hypothetical protein
VLSVNSLKRAATKKSANYFGLPPLKLRGTEAGVWVGATTFGLHGDFRKLAFDDSCHAKMAAEFF